jgi:hypothetical protein
VVRVLFARVGVRWRLGIGWCFVVLLGLPVIALLLGLIVRGSWISGSGLVLIKQTRPDCAGRVVINLREETV